MSYLEQFAYQNRFYNNQMKTILEINKNSSQKKKKKKKKHFLLDKSLDYQFHLIVMLRFIHQRVDFVVGEASQTLSIPLEYFVARLQSADRIGDRILFDFDHVSARLRCERILTAAHNFKAQ